LSLHHRRPTPPPPTSPPFPYTTLFRSRVPRAGARRAGGNLSGARRRRPRADGGGAGGLSRGARRRGKGPGSPPGRRRRPAQRRRSEEPRLNSSHVSISYAVFCLKKKKNLVIAYTVGCTFFLPYHNIDSYLFLITAPPSEHRATFRIQFIYVMHFTGLPIVARFSRL